MNQIFGTLYVSRICNWATSNSWWKILRGVGTGYCSICWSSALLHGIVECPSICLMPLKNNFFWWKLCHVECCFIIKVKVITALWHPLQARCINGRKLKLFLQLFIFWYFMSYFCYFVSSSLLKVVVSKFLDVLVLLSIIFIQIQRSLNKTDMSKTIKLTYFKFLRVKDFLFAWLIELHQWVASVECLWRRANKTSKTIFPQ